MFLFFSIRTLVCCVLHCVLGCSSKNVFTFNRFNDVDVVVVSVFVADFPVSLTLFYIFSYGRELGTVRRFRFSRQFPYDHSCKYFGNTANVVCLVIRFSLLKYSAFYGRKVNMIFIHRITPHTTNTHPQPTRTPTTTQT